MRPHEEARLDGVRRFALVLRPFRLYQIRHVLRPLDDVLKPSRLISAQQDVVVDENVAALHVQFRVAALPPV